MVVEARFRISQEFPGSSEDTILISQSQLNFLSEKQTNFIFASLAEEFGFVGSVAVLLVYAVLIFMSLRAAALLGRHGDDEHDDRLRPCPGAFAEPLIAYQQPAVVIVRPLNGLLGVPSIMSLR